jgi:hypothetical protein
MFTACFRGQRVAAVRNMPASIRHVVVAALVAAALSLAAPASAVTLDQVIGLARAGVTDAVILALIDRDKTIFAIEPEQLVKLKREGLSEAVILALLKSGRAEGDDAARADAANNAAYIASTLAPGPQLVIVGHGPERPNVPTHSFYASPPAAIVVAPYLSPYADSSLRRRPTRASGSRRGSEPRTLCYAETRTATSVKPLTYVTECPAAMQPRR